MPKESLWTYFRILIYANFNVIPPEDITLENYLWYIHLNGEKKTITVFMKTVYSQMPFVLDNQ